MSRNWRIIDQNELYFITFATVNWIDVFIRREYKDILIDSFRFCQKEKGLELFSWVIMTNHIHVIGRTKEGYNMSDVLRDFKKFTSAMLIKAIQDNPKESKKELMLAYFSKAGEFNNNNTKYQFWQQDNKPIILYTNEIIQQKINYIHDNPVRAGFVDLAEHYSYSSAMDYANKKGLLEVIVF
jgi:REP element-mobilizing transposase RayT